MGGSERIAGRERSLLSTLKLGYLRHIVQAQILILTVYGLAVASLPIHILWRVDPLLGISAALAGRVVPVSFLIVGSGMLLASLVLGRAFCGWICPLGFVQDLVFPLRELGRRLGGGLRICDEPARPGRPPHLMICKGKGNVIGHVVWARVRIEDLGEPREGGEALERSLGSTRDLLEIREIWLRDEYRGKGFERKVLNLFEEFARNRGHRGIVAMLSNTPTASILRQYGYKESPLGSNRRALILPLSRGFSVPEGARHLKYVLLVAGLIMAGVAGWTILEWITPLSVVPRALANIYGPRNGIIVGLSVFMVAVIFTVLTEKRAWCRYVCPLGAVLSLPSARKLVGIKLNERRCIRCLRCERACTMGIIDVRGQSGLRWDSECIACLACRDACPVDAIGLELRT